MDDDGVEMESRKVFYLRDPVTTWDSDSRKAVLPDDDDDARLADLITGGLFLFLSHCLSPPAAYLQQWQWQFAVAAAFQLLECLMLDAGLLACCWLLFGGLRGRRTGGCVGRWKEWVASCWLASFCCCAALRASLPLASR